MTSAGGPKPPQSQPQAGKPDHPLAEPFPGFCLGCAVSGPLVFVGIAAAIVAGRMWVAVVTGALGVAAALIAVRAGRRFIAAGIAVVLVAMLLVYGACGGFGAGSVFR